VKNVSFSRLCEQYSVATSERILRGNPEFCQPKRVHRCVHCVVTKATALMDTESEYQNENSQRVFRIRQVQHFLT